MSKKSEHDHLLTPSQREALKLLRSKDNVFVTGAAGTGKSFLIKHYMKNYNKNLPVICSTGMAAIIVGGKTFHSFFGLGISDNKDFIVGNSIENPFIERRLKKAKAILIDEVSMISGFSFECADEICRIVRENDEPFGGIRIIAVGDFYQLPPVTRQKEGEPKVVGSDWVFKTDSWKEMNFKPAVLKDFMRTTDTEFLNVLSNIREGLFGPVEYQFLKERKYDPTEEFVGTRIFARKKDVEEYNKECLEKLPGIAHKFETVYKGETRYIDQMKKSLPVNEVLEVKIGALVMIRTNAKDGSHVNGTLGILKDCSTHTMTIQKLDGNIVFIGKHTFELLDGDGAIRAAATAFPIVCAYSITIHKSQGQSIDHAVVDLYALFASGQAYTSLSRLTNSEGLRILKFSKESIFADPEVHQFYKSLESKIKN